jgi:CRP-like cAMP-binding protein
VHRSHDLTARITVRLVDLADRYGEVSGSRVRIRLPLSQEELAAWVGVSREAVSMALRALRERGWIETHRRGVTVLDWFLAPPARDPAPVDLVP